MNDSGEGPRTDAQDPSDNHHLIVEAEGLTVRYQGSESQALKGIDLELERGEAVALVGHTGAGKSTLLKCLNGLIPNFQRCELTGSLNVYGLIPREHGVSELAGAVGIVFQEFENQLFSTNVEQEVAFGPENLGVEPGEIRARIKECLEFVGLAGFENREPAALSGGEKQRLAIASVLA
ncbi:MAG: ABC transporter ATP-binding protein, partial [Candidatus Coatesbacteria bacterium]|nr:ABC transporter ATP-binding protein [Candidatus Coatesbacteria bacterium]